jgi:hypothetical protein
MNGPGGRGRTSHNIVSSSSGSLKSKFATRPSRYTKSNRPLGDATSHTTYGEHEASAIGILLHVSVTLYLPKAKLAV